MKSIEMLFQDVLSFDEPVSSVFGRDVSRDPKKLATGILGGGFLVLGLLLAIL